METTVSGAMEISEPYKTFKCTPEILIPIHATRYGSPHRMIKDFTHITRYPTTNEQYGTNSSHTIQKLHNEIHNTHRYFPKHVSISKIGECGSVEIRCKCGFTIETNTNRLIHCGIAFDDMHRHTVKCTK
jgi:hypothetical protein